MEKYILVRNFLLTKNFFNIYLLDMREHDILTERKNLEDSLSETEDNISKLEKDIMTTEKDLAAVNLLLKTLNGDLKELEQKEKDTNAKILTVTSEKQLAAYNAELSGLSDKKSEFEDKILEQMELEEQNSEELEKMKDLLEKSQIKKDELTQKIVEHKKVNDPSIDELKEEREILLSKLPAILKSKYNRVKTKYYNPLVPVKDSVCSGCMINVSSSVTNELNEKEYSECQNCKRLLILEA